MRQHVFMGAGLKSLVAHWSVTLMMTGSTPHKGAVSVQEKPGGGGA